MLICVIGSPCSGKDSVCKYLVNHHGFKRLQISTTPKEQFLEFPNTSTALQYVMLERRWMENWVISIVNPDMDLLEMRKRPFLLLLSVDAPLSIRYFRYKGKFQVASSSINMERFAELNDEYMFSNNNYLYNLMHSADIKLLNGFADWPSLQAYLLKSDLANFDRCRPSWDTYFIKLSEWSARRSNCMKRRVGCVLVKDNRIIATGYNGTPRGLQNCNAGGCTRCNNGTAKCGEALDQCLCMHAEENALLEAGRQRIESGNGHTVLYCTTCPCIGCAKKIVQCGVKEVVYHHNYGTDSTTFKLFMSVGVEIRQYIGVNDELAGDPCDQMHVDCQSQ